MTTVVVMADPPEPGLVLPDIGTSTPIEPDDAARLYGAMLKDVALAVHESGGELLVNFRPSDALPSATDSPDDGETRIRSLLEPVVPDVRYEPQVGETLAGRVGNTVTHLLEREGVQTAAAVEPVAALLSRKEIDSAAMKLRRSDVVLGPSTGGRVYYAGFAEPIEFTDAYGPPAVRTLTERAVAAGLDIDFLPTIPILETGTDLVTVLALLSARREADRPVPKHTSDVLEDMDLVAEASEAGLAAVRATDRP